MKSNLPMRAANTGKEIRNPRKKNLAKGSILKFEWKVKENIIPNKSRKTFFFKIFSENCPSKESHL